MEAKTKEQLIAAIESLRREVAELEQEKAERKWAEEALQESKEFSSSLVNNSPNPILVINPDTSVRHVNPALEELIGFTSAELVGRKAPYPWWTEETLHKTRRDFEEAMRQGVRRVEELFQKKSGERFWVKMTSAPVISNREFKYYLSNWVDITERKWAEQALKESEELHKAVVENVADAIAISIGTKRVFVNKAFLKIHGLHDMSQVLGMPQDQFILPEDRKMVNERTLARERGYPVPGVYEYRICRPSGEVRTVQTSAVATSYKGQPATLAILRDITEGKKAEEEIKYQRKYFQALFEGSPEAVASLDTQNRIMDLNPAFEKIFGYTLGDVKGKDINDCLLPKNKEEEGRGISRRVNQGRLLQWSLLEGGQMEAECLPPSSQHQLYLMVSK